MGTRIEKDTSFSPVIGKFPETNIVKMLSRWSMLLVKTAVPTKGPTKIRDKFKRRNIAKSLSPLVNNLFGSRESATAYFERYTLEIMNPVMKMNDGVKKRRYL
jgi:hypothetical protein